MSAPHIVSPQQEEELMVQGVVKSSHGVLVDYTFASDVLRVSGQLCTPPQNVGDWHPGLRELQRFSAEPVSCAAHTLTHVDRLREGHGRSG
ncbi:hypothetical protein G7K_6330-t1 [Saitoella complicata NRRL Y-17804]|uniref:Uncharacterized protein n=1 Tax=Saitoella complicata (strain BCRC 22490 / CBS 7301 / JCM 7358 / NBRC 10748 / NRRL Y-17804) TaxID=698492 RepID=A0A0E9NQW5_SAICN|nr:hypothetical protein G7K_6330-t1 [Saitoella complicata NRRL Y-17804]